MYFLFIFESIGTSELLLIGVIALIVFGPRKIPELAKMFGKTMTEFRKATNDFKDTWQREVDLESLKADEPEPPKTIAQAAVIPSVAESNTISPPAIREISEADFPGGIQPVETTQPAAAEEIVRTDAPPEEEDPHGKQEWL